MGNDLNRLPKPYCGFTSDGRKRVFRPNHLFSIDGSYFIQAICANRRQVQRGLQVSALHLQKPVLLHGLLRWPGLSREKTSLLKVDFLSPSLAATERRA